jgi:hypothetical protein
MYTGIILWWSEDKRMGVLADVGGFTHRFFAAAVQDIPANLLCGGTFVDFDAITRRNGARIVKVRLASAPSEEDAAVLRDHLDMWDWKNAQRTLPRARIPDKDFLEVEGSNQTPHYVAKDTRNGKRPRFSF